jgi:hypothetical protein
MWFTRASFSTCYYVFFTINLTSYFICFFPATYKYKARIRRGPVLEAAIGKAEAAIWGGRTVAIKIQRPGWWECSMHLNQLSSYVMPIKVFSFSIYFDQMSSHPQRWTCTLSDVQPCGYRSFEVET